MKMKPAASALRTTFAGLALWSAFHAVAGPLPSALTVQAGITMDAANSVNPTGTATQSVTLSRIIGGVTTSSSFTDTVAAISQAGALTQTGDGLRALFSMSGSGGTSSTTDGLFADFLFQLSNSSATQTLTVVFQTAFDNRVSAAGADAFAYSDISVRDALNSELDASDHRVDALDPSLNLNFDDATDTFNLVLAPGASTSISALQRQRGGSFADGSSYSASLDARIWIQEVRTSGGPPPPPNGVPLPGTLALALAGLAGLAWRGPARRGAADR